MKTLFVTLCAFNLLFQTTATLKPNDLEGLVGRKWTGTLTYLDYSTNKLEPIETELTVYRDKEPGSYSFITVYPNETSHNSTDKTVITKDGKQIDDETVIERTITADGTLKLITVKEGKDNNKKASFRFTYLISKITYSRKKEVCYVGSTSWFTRNELILKAN